MPRLLLWKGARNQHSCTTSMMGSMVLLTACFMTMRKLKPHWSMYVFSFSSTISLTFVISIIKVNSVLYGANNICVGTVRFYRKINSY